MYVVAHRAGHGTFSQFRPFNSFSFFPTCIFLVVDSVSKSCLSSTRPKPAAAPLPPRFLSAFQPRQAHVQLPHLSPSRTQNLEFPRNNRCKSFLPHVCRVRGMQLILPDVCRVRTTCSQQIIDHIRSTLSGILFRDANHFFPTYVVYVGELFLGGTSLDFSNPGPGFCPACGVVGDNPPDHCGISCLSRPTTAPTAYFFRRLRLPMTQQSVFPR